MPVIRQPNFTDKTWDVKMRDIPIVVGNHTENRALQTISLSDYLSNFSDFMTNDHYRKSGKSISLLAKKEGKDSHVVMSSQCCFLPIIKAQETKFNVALYNYQSQPKNPAVLVIVSTSKGSSAQIIEGRQQHLLFNNLGKTADFVGERVSDVRQKKGQENIYDKVLSKEEKQDNVIVVVQVPLKKRVIPRAPRSYKSFGGGYGGYPQKCKGLGGGGYATLGLSKSFKSRRRTKCAPSKGLSRSIPKPNVEAAMVSVSTRTKPVCKCKKEMDKICLSAAYGGAAVECDGCGKTIGDEMIYHCPDGKNSYHHRQGHDLCLNCGDKQLKFDELRGLLETVKDYKLERNEEYPVRVTLQYYKATNNGVINKEIMDDIVKQLEQSQKQADFMGSLVTEYDPKRPTEWVEKKEDIAKPVDPLVLVPVVMDNDEYTKIRSALEKYCGSDWKQYMANFEKEEVMDSDLESIREDDLKELIPKMGPRKRFWKWMQTIQK